MTSKSYTDNELGQLSSVIKFVRNNDNFIAFEVGNQKFNLTVPKDKDSSYFIELPITLKGYEWLNRLNEFIFEKNPNLETIIKHIETKYNETKKLPITKSNDRFWLIRRNSALIGGCRRALLGSSADLDFVEDISSCSCQGAYPQIKHMKAESYHRSRQNQAESNSGRFPIVSYCNYFSGSGLSSPVISLTCCALKTSFSKRASANFCNCALRLLNSALACL